jgi:L-fucose isomerase-like protein
MCCLDRTISRRTFTGAAGAGFGMGGMALGAPAAPAPSWPVDLWDPDRPFVTHGRALRIRPVLLYATPVPKQQTSWKSWGGVLTEAAAQEETARIDAELAALRARAGFALKVLPTVRASSVEAVQAWPQVEADVTIVYPAAGSAALWQAATPESGHAILFVRHRSGPVSYWYEALSTRLLRKSGVDWTPGAPRLSVDDVVVDDPNELLWRLRALYGVQNFKGTRIVALGGPWGKYASGAPQVARENFGFDIVDVSYDDFAKRIASALGDAPCMQRASAWTDRFLKLPGTTLETERAFVVNAFVLYGVLRDILRERSATVFTIKSCMNVVLPMARTTACLTLGFLNDEGMLAFCESDFAVIPPLTLLRYIAGRPVFMHNSTFPHNGIVTCAHCAAPRRMDGQRYEPTRLVTHYESEYGASPKVEIPIGQAVTFLNPEYDTCRWVGMRGVVEANPFLPICRSQQDVRIQGDWRRLLNEVRDSHWAMVYGDYIRELVYAAPRAGVRLETI